MAGSLANRYPLILQGIAQGLSGAKILGELRNAGLGLRTQTFYRLVGQARTEVGARTGIAGLGPHQTPDAASVPTWPSATKTGFAHIVSFASRDLVTGAVKTTRVTIRSDTLLTRGEAEAAALDTFSSNEDYGQGLTLLGFAQIMVRQLVPVAV